MAYILNILKLQNKIKCKKNTSEPNESGHIRWNITKREVDSKSLEKNSNFFLNVFFFSSEHNASCMLTHMLHVDINKSQIHIIMSHVDIIHNWSFL